MSDRDLRNRHREAAVTDDPRAAARARRERCRQGECCAHSAGWGLPLPPEDAHGAIITTVGLQTAHVVHDFREQPEIMVTLRVSTNGSKMLEAVANWLLGMFPREPTTALKTLGGIAHSYEGAPCAHRWGPWRRVEITPSGRVGGFVEIAYCTVSDCNHVQHKPLCNKINSPAGRCILTYGHKGPHKGVRDA